MAGLVAYRAYPIGFSRDGRATSRILALEVSGNYFDVLGVSPFRGRVLHPNDDLRKLGHPVVVVGFNFWRQRLASDPNVVGTTVKLNGLDYTVIGIAPAGFFGTELVLNTDVFVPMAMQSQLEVGDDWMEGRRSRNIFVLGRLKPGINVRRAEADLNSILTQLARDFPEADEGWRISLSRPGLFGDIGRGPVLEFSVVLMIVAGMVLMVACVNLASLLLARASDRRKETAIRFALGARRTDLIRQLLTESAMLSIAGGAAALFLTNWLVHLLAAWRASANLPMQDLHIDTHVLAFTAAASIVTGTIAGLMPAMQSIRGGLTPALKDAVVVEGLKHWHMRDGLVVVQVALSAALLVGSILVVRSLQHALTVPLGFQPQHAATASFDLSLHGYDRAYTRQFEKRVLERVSSMPGIDAAGLINGLPLTLAISNCYIFVEGKPPLRDSDAPMAARYWSSPGYLRAAQTKLIDGRDFDARDEVETSRAVLVNQAFARQLFPGENAIGKQFRYCDQASEPREIVGIVEDGKYRTLDEEALPAVFTPLTQFTMQTGTIVARSSLPEAEVAGMIRRAVLDIEPTLFLFDVGSMSEQLRLALLPAAVAATALGAFGLLAMALAATGVYGIMAYAVSRRTREIGIRMSLGASSAIVLRLVLDRTAILIAVGTVSGLGLTLAAGGFLGPLLYGVSARDPIAYLVTLLLMALVGVLACLVPARRALKVDQLIALRSE
jgi:predicted permease